MTIKDMIPFILLGAMAIIIMCSIFAPVISDLINNSDCQEYCTRNGYARHYYWNYKDTCECSEAPDMVLKCVRKCGSKDSHYNEFNGRCYCT